jgi:cytochrome oxidase Cu insertion factor (SCO1/SenC/PrrC family)
MLGAGLPVHSHEAPGAGRDREAADAAAPAFGTAIDFELTDAGGNRVRAVDLRGRWLLIFFGYTSCPGAGAARLRLDRPAARHAQGAA